jgi:hypothetical protein
MRKWTLGTVLAVAAAAGLFFYLSRGERPVQAQGMLLDRALLALLPPQAASLMGVDVESLKRTPLYQHFEEESRRSGGRNHFDEFAIRTGFDPRRDVQELLVAGWTGPGENDSEFVALARGQYNVAELSRQLRENKASVEPYRGFDLFGPQTRPARTRRGPGRRTPEDVGRFAFLDDRTVVAGTRGAVIAAIDRKIGGGPSLLDKTELLGRAQAVRGGSQVWAVSDSPGSFVSRALPPRPQAGAASFVKILNSMTTSTISLDLMNGLDLKVAGECQTPQDAKTLADAARGVAALGRLSIPQEKPELLVLFDGIQVEERSTGLTINVRVDAQNFQKLLETTRSKRRTETVSLPYASPMSSFQISGWAAM